MSEPMKPSAEAISKVNLLLQELGWGLPVTAIRVALRNAYAIDFATQQAALDGLVGALQACEGLAAEDVYKSQSTEWHAGAVKRLVTLRAALAQAKGVQR